MSELLLDFNSDFSSNENLNHPEFKFYKTLRICKSIEVMSCQIPLTNYNVVDGLNDFSVNYNSIGMYTYTVPPGLYDATQLCYTITSLAQAPNLGTADEDLVLTWDDVTKKITVNNPTQTFSIPDDYLNVFVIGLTANIAAFEFSHVATNAPDLRESDAFYVYCSVLAGAKSNYGFLSEGNIKPNILLKIPFADGIGGVANYRSNHSSNRYEITNILVSNIKFELRNKDGEQIDLNGVPWSIQLKTYVE